MVESTVHPGLYAVRISDPTGLAHLDSFEVSLGKTAYLNLTLSEGIELILSAASNESVSVGDIFMTVSNIKNEAFVKIGASNSSGLISLLLPAGAYYISAESSSIERGRYVDFSGNAEINLSSNTALNIVMKKSLEYSFDATWPSEQKTSMAPGDTITYFITISNTGNIKDSYTYAAFSADFDVPSSVVPVTVDFGKTNNSMTVPIRITAKPAVRAEHDALYIEVTSVGDKSVKKSVKVDIDILPVHSVNLSTEIGGMINGTVYFAYLEVKNTGNVKDNYTIYITNANEMQINGWEASLGNTGMVTRTEDILSGASKKINVTFKAIRPIPNARVSVAVMAISNSSSASAVAEIGTSLPDLKFTSDGMSFFGNNTYVNNVFDEKDTENLTLTLVLLAMIAAIFVVRKIKFGRFLR